MCFLLLFVRRSHFFPFDCGRSSFLGSFKHSVFLGCCSLSFQHSHALIGLSARAINLIAIDSTGDKEIDNGLKP